MRLTWKVKFDLHSMKHLSKEWSLARPRVGVEVGMILGGFFIIINTWSLPKFVFFFMVSHCV